MLLALIDQPGNEISPARTVRLTEEQARGILELRLQRLTGLEREKIQADMAEVAEKIQGLKDEDAVRVAVSSNGKALGNSYKALTKKLMREQIIKEGKRVDGRNLDEVRPISAAAGLTRRPGSSGSASMRTILMFLSMPHWRSCMNMRVPTPSTTSTCAGLSFRKENSIVATAATCGSIS